MMQWLFDSHIHLSDSSYDTEMSLILNSMDKLHIKACCVSTDYVDSIKTLKLAKKSDLILPFIGTHPAKAAGNSIPVEDLIKKHHEEITGIGEIGLDKTYPNSEKEFKKQLLVFGNQLALAEKFQKPVSIHSRKALEEIYQMAPSYSLKAKLLHWFDGNKKQLKKAMDMEFFVSYGPVMVYSKDKQVLLSNTEANRILVETDGPVKFSRCFRLKSAQISFLPSVIFCGSHVLRKSYDELAEILEQNSKTFLGI